MKKRTFWSTVAALLTSLVLAYSNANAEASVVTNSLWQIKKALLSGYTPKRVKSLIDEARFNGATGYQLIPPRSKAISDMGWLVEDSSGFEVLRVYFTFPNGTAKTGRYLGPLISAKAARGTVEKIHRFHLKALANNYTPISSGGFDIGDGCQALPQVFEASSGSKRTVIHVTCTGARIQPAEERCSPIDILYKTCKKP